MDSSALLIKAASGVERYMGGSKHGVLKESLVAQVSAYVYYTSHVVASLPRNNQFQNKFTKTIFDQINKDFLEYVDALARTKPKSLHHVYEWKRAGQPGARLFGLKMLSQEDLSFKLGFEFKPSSTPIPSSNSKSRHVFVDKAAVMEAGNPVTIRPRNADRLIFEYEGSMVYMPKGKSVTVRRPGGSAATNQFVLAYARFFNGQLVNNSIKRSGFQNIFRSSLGKALKLPGDIKTVKYSFSPNTVRLQAESAVTLGFVGGA